LTKGCESCDNIADFLMPPRRKAVPVDGTKKSSKSLDKDANKTTYNAPTAIPDTIVTTPKRGRPAAVKKTATDARLDNKVYLLFQLT
jgi:hypothetical protein